VREVNAVESIKLIRPSGKPRSASFRHARECEAIQHAAAFRFHRERLRVHAGQLSTTEQLPG
jgi:hypothetical protein